MDIITAREIALNELAGEEYDHFDKAGYRIPAKRSGGRPGRTFMTIGPVDGSVVLMLNADLQTEVMDMAPNAFHPHPSKWGAKGATLAKLEQMDVRIFRRAVQMAYDHASR